MDATWWVPQSLPRLFPWSFVVFAADARRDVAVVDAGAIGLRTISRCEGVVDVVEVDVDLGLARDTIEIVEVDSIRAVVVEVADVVAVDAIFSVVEDAVAAIAADAISTVGEGVVDAVAADASAPVGHGAIAVDLSTPQPSTK